MNVQIRFYRDSTPNYIEERCVVRELSNNDADPAVSIAEATVAPGVSTRWHRLQDTVERYVLIAGTGQVEVVCSDSGSDEVRAITAETVSVGDVVIIPRNALQRIHNRGSESLVFLAICSPRFTFDAYHDAEEEMDNYLGSYEKV